MEYDPVAGSFSEAEGPHPEWITSVIPNLPGAAVAQPPASLVMSIPLDRAFPRSAGQATQPGAGYLLMELDELYLATTVLPDLVDNYLGTGEYHVSIVRGSAETPVWSYPDGSSPEYEYLTRDNADEVILVSLFPGAAADPVPARADPATWASGEILRRLQDPLVQQWLGFRYRRERELSLGSDVTRPDGGLSILVRHSSGSIGAAVRVGLNRNLGISYAALAVLAGAAIVYHAMFRRANRQRIREHEFVATVTHELRTPVAAIHAVADNLADGIVTESAQVRSYGDALLDEGKRLRDLIDQVLLYAGLQREGGKPHRSHVRVQELVNRACSRVPEIQPDRLTVHFESAAPVFRGDPVAVESVLSNLLSNAFKHNPQSTFVTLDVRTVPGPIRRSSGQGVILEITVSDDGRGISRSELRRVREPFFRGAQTQADQVPGSGLGLSLVRRIATVCRGTLEITSSPGKGTTAVVLLRFESGVGDES
jgi:signal transduction histidine kinase